MLVGLLTMTRCANMVAPTGGPKDTTPPKVVVAVPENHNTGFDGNKIEITFDEYVTLNNANQELLVSPPLAVKPDVKLSGKTVIVKFKEALLSNTTYTLSFGEAIKDLHEGNVFKDYLYSFSTGEWIDTLSIKGKVVSASDLKPSDNLFVCLYAGEGDSLFHQPTWRVPDFITKTDKNGQFSFSGLPEKPFLVFALGDVNSNLYYDMPNETVAFLDTLVNPSMQPQELTLYAFMETDTNQMLLEKKLIDEGVLRMVFRHPADSVVIEPLTAMPDDFRMIEVHAKTQDTIWWYFTPNVMDSLWFHVQYDTLIDERVLFNLQYREPQQRQRQGAKTLKVGNNLRNGFLLPGEALLLTFSEPIVDLRIPDSLGLRFEQQDAYGMVYRWDTVLNDTTHYTLHLSDSLFYSLRQRTNDSLNIRFKRAAETDFGNLMLTVAPPAETQVVLQLSDQRNRVVETHVIDTVAQVAFRWLIPGKYTLRAIVDADRNGTWSNGNFHRRFLPENTIDYKDPFEVRAGWDIDLEEPWILP